MKGERKPCLYAHVKWFYGQSERAYYLNYFIKINHAQTKLIHINTNLSIENVTFIFDNLMSH